MKYAVLIIAVFFCLPVFANEIGKPAPDFFMLSLKNESVNLSEFKGTPVVLNFFAEWCEPCKKELPELAELAELYPSVRFVAVDTEQKSAQKVVDFLNKLPAHPEEIYFIFNSESTRELTKVSEGLPLTWIIDADMTLKNILRGFDRETLNSAIKAIAN